MSLLLCLKWNNKYDKYLSKRKKKFFAVRLYLDVRLYNIMKYYIYNSSNYCLGFNAAKKFLGEIILVT